MSKVIVKHEVSINIDFIDFFNFALNVLHKEKTHQIIESYDMFIGYEKGEDNIDATYRRAAETVQELSCDFMKERFLLQLEYGQSPVVEGEDLQPLLEDATVASLMNYGTPTHCIKLEDNLYVLGPVKSENVKLKTMSETEGAIIVRTPGFFTIIRIKE